MAKQQATRKKKPAKAQTLIKPFAKEIRIHIVGREERKDRYRQKNCSKSATIEHCEVDCLLLPAKKAPDMPPKRKKLVVRTIEDIAQEIFEEIGNQAIIGGYSAASCTKIDNLLKESQDIAEKNKKKKR